MVSDPIVVVAKLAKAFDELGIPYVVGGSLASSVYGTPRATLDVDVIAAIPPTQITQITRLLSPDFEVDPAMVREAVEERGSFNAIYLPTMFKADIFIARDDPWSREELTRGVAQRLETADGVVSIRFASPEDTLLHKLYWYRLGNEMSGHQWKDVVGMLKVLKGTLDDAYIERWAGHLDVVDLLERARRA